MALFDVEGWGLEDQKVAPAPTKSEKKQKNEKRTRDDGEENHKRSKRSRKERNHEKKHQKRHVEEKKEEQVQGAPEAPVAGAPDAVAALQSTSANLTPLQQKMLSKLSGSRFRWINEQLYTTDSQKAYDMMTKQPELFDEYHKGFRSQVESWPENPVDIYTKELVFRGVNRMINAPGGLPGVDVDGKRTVVVADMGCGEAQLATDIDHFMDFYGKDPKKALKVFKKKYGGNADIAVKNKRLNMKVHSFDLKKYNDKITVADIKHVPMPDESCSVVIFCLSLMGTNFLDFVEEAKRILVPRGELWIAEIQSRLSDDSGAEFAKTLSKLGFKHKETDTGNKMFTRFEFMKPVRARDQEQDLDDVRVKGSEGKWLLKPCIYKRR